MNKKEYYKQYYQKNKDKSYYKPKDRYFLLEINNHKFVFDTKQDILNLISKITKQDITVDMYKYKEHR